MEGTEFIAPFVPCSEEAAVAALKLVKISSSDTLLDMGMYSTGQHRQIITALDSVSLIEAILSN
jgi:hypothetical protein